MAESTASVFPEAAESCWGCGGQLTEASPDCSNPHHPVPPAPTPCHPFDEPCGYGTGGPCRNHGGVVPAWVPCPTTDCAPELTKENCMSCPERPDPLIESAKAHIQRKHDEAKQRVRDSWEKGVEKSMPTFSWADAVTWLDDWQPDA